MYLFHNLVCILPLVLMFASLPTGTHGAVFITHPYAGITCNGGQDCVVTWADDGTAPLLNAVGPSNIALYMDSTTLVQQLAAGIDISQTRSLTFKPDPKAGPNSNSYYIWLTSVSAHDPNNTALPYSSFSGRFTIDGMSGTDNHPVASDTSSLSPSSSVSSTTNGIVSTTTLSAPSGITPTVTPILSSSSGVTTVTSPSSFQTSRSTSSSSTTSASSSSPTPTSSTNAATRTISLPLWRFGAASVIVSFLSFLI